MFVCMYVCMYVYIYMYVCMYVCLYVCICAVTTHRNNFLLYSTGAVDYGTAPAGGYAAGDAVGQQGPLDAGALQYY